METTLERPERKGIIRNYRDLRAELLGTIKHEQAQALLGRTAEISRMLAGLTTALRAKKSKP